MKRALVCLLFLIAATSSMAQTSLSLVWDVYPGTSLADAAALYRYGVYLDGSTQPVMLAPTCDAQTCTAQLPTSASGSPRTLTLRVACASTPTIFGQSTPTLMFTAGGAVPPPLIVPPPPPNPCAPPAPPAPTPTPTPAPTPTSAGSCVEVSAGTDAAGHVWTINSGWTYRDADYSMPGGAARPGAAGSIYAFVGGIAHVKDSRDGLWYRWNESGANWVLVGAAVPACSAPPPPTAPPAVTGTIAVSIAQCRYVVTDKSPDGKTTGWTVQFRRNGVKAGDPDSASPYLRTLTRSAVAGTWDGVWTRAGVQTVKAIGSTQPDCR